MSRRRSSRGLAEIATWESTCAFVRSIPPPDQPPPRLSCNCFCISIVSYLFIICIDLPITPCLLQYPYSPKVDAAALSDQQPLRDLLLSAVSTFVPNHSIFLCSSRALIPFSLAPLFLSFRLTFSLSQLFRSWRLRYDLPLSLARSWCAWGRNGYGALRGGIPKTKRPATSTLTLGWTQRRRLQVLAVCSLLPPLLLLISQCGRRAPRCLPMVLLTRSGCAFG